MTPHGKEPAAMTSGSAPTTDPETNTMHESDHGLRYTQEELTKLRPAQMSPTGSLQPDNPTEAEAVSQVQTSVNPTAPDTKIGAEQHSELTGVPTAIVVDKREDNHELDQMAQKRPSIAGGMKDENGEAVWPSETQGTGPSDGAPAIAETKKKKKKSTGKKKKPTPTGFEEFFADPPITPEDHKEEIEQLYHL